MTISRPPSLLPPRSNGSPAIELNAVVEQIWRQLDGQASRAHIHQVAATVAADFAAATVTAFLPIFIHRDTLEKLRIEGTGERRQA